MPIDLDDDSEELIYCVERKLLRKVFGTSINLCEGRDCKEFAEAVGGIERLETEHEEATASLRAWYWDGDR